jgi:cullin-4
LFAQRSFQTIVSKIVLLPPAEEEEMIPQLLAFKSFVDSLLVAAFREEAKVQFDDGSPVKKEPADKGKGKAGASFARNKRTDKKKRGKGPFGYAATDAFAKGFGKRQRKPAEMIGAFCVWYRAGEAVC